MTKGAWVETTFERDVREAREARTGEREARSRVAAYRRAQAHGMVARPLASTTITSGRGVASRWSSDDRKFTRPNTTGHRDGVHTLPARVKRDYAHGTNGRVNFNVTTRQGTPRAPRPEVAKARMLGLAF